jgi:hypothetical protein
LVVASQFPLSVEGSVPLARTMYQGLLWGEHPLLLLQRLRAQLHSRYNSTRHDWASLVVYEALPLKLGDQLYFLRYGQSRRALDAALEGIDRAVQGKSDHSLAKLSDAVELAVQHLPLEGQYAVECLGLRASARKRLAQAAFTLAARSPGETGSWDQLDLLEQAWGDYREAVRRLLVKEGPEGTTVQRVATLHWVLVQAVCLDAVLGKTAKFSADLHCVHNDLEERAYAFGSLAELYLLRLAGQSLSKEDQQKLIESALAHADRLVSAYPFRSEFPVTSTLRQFRRYVDWWGSEGFEEALAARGPTPRPAWDALIETAKMIIKKLERQTAPLAPAASSPPPAPEETASPPAASMPAEGGSTPPVAADAALNVPGRSRASRLATAKRKPAAPTRVPHRTSTFFDIEMLPAGHGDSL